MICTRRLWRKDLLRSVLRRKMTQTIHTFQGQNVGPAGNGRPENPIQRIVLEPGDRKFEGNNVGLFYTAMSRATTIGNTGDRISSAVYFDSPHFSIERFTNLT
jgi:hypothetical protein